MDMQHRAFTRARAGEQLTTDLQEDCRRRLVNQRQFRQHFVKCACERGCLVCAYTGLVSKGHARQTA